MTKSEQKIFQELAEKFKWMEKSFLEIKVEIKAELKELQQEKVNKFSLKNYFFLRRVFIDNKS